jgi:murein endopeptidase
MCSDRTIDDIFAGKPDNLLLAFDALLNAVMPWEPQTVGAAVHAIVFTNRNAWLVVKPMAKVLDLKFYYDRPLQSPYLHKVGPMYGKKYSHHIRIADEEELTDEIVDLLRQGFDFGLR